MLLQNSWRLTWWQGCFKQTVHYEDEIIPTGWAPPLRRWLRSSLQREGSSLLFNSVNFLLYQRCLYPFTCLQYSTWWYILFSYPYSVGHKFFAIFHPKNFITLLVAVRANGLVDSVSARKFLEAADKTGDKRIFFTVFRLSLQKLLFCKKNTFNWFSFQLFWGEKP